MNQLTLLTGVDVPIPELQLTLHQPRIKEIAYVGEIDYFTTLQLLCFDKSTLIAANPQGSSILSAMSNFQIFMTLISPPDANEKNERQGKIIDVLTILFAGYQVQIMPNNLGIYLNNPITKHNIMINETNFDILKKVITECSGVNNATGGQNAGFKPKGAKAAAIAAKLLKGRARVAQAKGQSSSEGTLGRYVSILTIGLSSMSLDDCLNLTVYQLYDLLERYGLYIGWDLDIRSRLAGGKPDNKPDDWMKDIH